MSFSDTLNLGNSIIGVSILTMPYCFKKCGIVLSIILILLSGLLNRVSCHFLLKSAIIARRRNFEILAFHVFGPIGKLIVEIGILGFLLGTCIAFFVVIGDLGPALVSDTFGISNGPQLRAFVLTFLGVFVALPLGLLRRVESLTSFSALSLALYAFLAFKMFLEASENLTMTSKLVLSDLNYWDSSFVLLNLPIFSMALSCQTQLFEIFDSSVLSTDMESMKKMNHIVGRAINICSCVYISVGYLGYLAFYDEPYKGNILLYLPSGVISTITKIGFIFTVVISFPLCLFPCRTSLYSFFFRKGTYVLLNDASVTTSSSSLHMSDKHFRLLTIVLIVTTIGVSILLPRIELVLGILGSTIGSVICFILPAAIFINLTQKNTNERLLAHAVVVIGVFILIVCSFTNIHDIYSVNNNGVTKGVTVNNLVNSIKIDAITKRPFVPNNLDPEAINKEESEIKLHPNNPESAGNDREQNIKPSASDLTKAKRQEELLMRLEKQQQEHKKLLEQQKELINQMKEQNSLLQNSKKVKDSPKEIENQKGNESIVSKNAVPKLVETKEQNIEKKNDIKEKSNVKVIEHLPPIDKTNNSNDAHSLRKNDDAIQNQIHVKSNDQNLDKLNVINKEHNHINQPQMVAQKADPIQHMVMNHLQPKDKVKDEKTPENDLKEKNIEKESLNNERLNRRNVLTSNLD